ncbi:VanZ family protein [Vibrio salinus]|uniref:VanZ family protein n=1 Tax=Vibrio salinus TaxID=2899784 RepID=UPI0035681E6D
MKIIKLILLVIFASLIGYVSLSGGTTPNIHIPSMNSYGINHLDKILHLLAYLIFTCLGALIFHKKRSLNLYYLGLFFYSLALELLQIPMPLRQASFSDLSANILGILTGIILNYLLKKRIMYVYTHQISSRNIKKR